MTTNRWCPAASAHPPVTRRSVLGLAAAGLATAGLAGCGHSHRADPAAARAGQRLVTLDGTTAALALITGRDQVGAVPFLNQDPIIAAASTMQGRAVADVATASGEVDPERVAAARPGLIAGLQRGPSPTTALGQLAPVRLVPRTGRLDRDAARLGDAIGAGPAARRLLSTLHSAQQTVGRQVAARRPPSVSILSPGPTGSEVFTLSTATPAGATATALRLPRPAAQRHLSTVGMPFQRISPERLDEHDADLILLLTGPTADPAALQAQPVWKRLRAVRSGRVVRVDAFRWATMSCLLGSWWVLDDFAAILLHHGDPVHGVDSTGGLERIRRYRGLARPT